jgi:hypothetical protein
MSLRSLGYTHVEKQFASKGEALTWATLTTMSAMEVAFCRMMVALLFMAFTIWSVVLRVS